MRFQILPLFAVSSSLLANAAPFTPQDGTLQRARRRAVDYPVQSFQLSHAEPQHQRRRRALSYEVVQVDGSIPDDEDSTGSESTTTTTAPPCTETVVLTSTITGPSSEETVVITTTREVTASSPTLTSSSSSAPPPPPPARILRAQQVTNTVQVVETITATPTATPTYYDNGLWHTFYPVKTIEARAPTDAPSPAVKPRRARRAMTPVVKAAPAIVKARDAFPAPPIVDPATEDIGIIAKRDANADAEPSSEDQVMREDLERAALVTRSEPAPEEPMEKKAVKVVSWDENDLTRREHKGLERFMRR